ncbi:cobalamin-binding protein [bacterium]|nr:cobalamin-binding protein [bacterium]
MKLRLVIVTLVCILALSTAANANYPMKVKDARGKVVTIKAKPMRIVSIAPSNTEILYALGLEKRVVGVTKYCNYPPKAAKKKIVGDMNISAETVLALKPDLVIAHSYINAGVITRLEKLGLKVFAVDPKTLNQVMRDIRTIGKITGRPKTAESVVAKMKRKIAQVKSSRAKQKPENVLVVIQANPLWAAGPKTFVDEMIGLAHAKNISHDGRPGFVTFSKELAISRNPDVIITGQKQDVHYFLTDPAWKQTSAAKHGRVFVIDNDLLVRPGPRLADGLSKLAIALSHK